MDRIQLACKIRPGTPMGKKEHQETDSAEMQLKSFRINHQEQKVRYLTFKDLQEKLGGRGRTTIYRDIDQGRLPRPKKLGARLYWAEGDIDAAISEMTT